ncbi:hypothetical protein [uncultured Kordia sp.]|uniref:hypothetical protein n=1 Tax=uncultured Kordia sp. TaxID=507699 RepID=UPI00262EF6E2|nr:hypothetical protein [uncultured Kordia sp.]
MKNSIQKSKGTESTELTNTKNGQSETDSTNGQSGTTTTTNTSSGQSGTDASTGSSTTNPKPVVRPVKTVVDIRPGDEDEENPKK